MSAKQRDNRGPSGPPGQAALVGAPEQTPQWERWAFPGMLLVVVAFMAPALTGWAPVYHEDSVVSAVPQLIGMARHVRQGEVPLWNPHTFAGGQPAYVEDEAPLFYPVMLPFYLLADLDDMPQCYYVLMVIPWVLHVLWAAAGGYLFGRWVLRLRPVAAALASLVYALGPDLADVQVAVSEVMTHSHLPWIMLAVARFLETRRARWWIAGTVLLAVAYVSGDFHRAVRMAFVAGLLAFLWALFTVWKQPRALRVLPAAVAMQVVAAGLAGPTWGGMIELLTWFGRNTGLDAAQQVNTALPPSGLVMLFAPTFLGILDSRHGWGVGLAERMYTISFLSGGLLTVFAAATGVAMAGFRSAKTPDDPQRASLRVWTRVHLALFCLVLIFMLGSNTLLWKPLTAVMPWLKLPRTVYYRFAETWFLAVLAGTGISCLLSRQFPLRQAVRWAVLGGCLLAAAGLAVAALWTTVTWRRETMPGYETLTRLNEWDWFLHGPVLYLGVATAVLVGVVAASRARLAAWVLPAGVAVEAILFAVPWFYQVGVGPRDQDETGPMASVTARRYHSVQDHPYYRSLSRFRELVADKDVRMVGTRSDLDNLAWVTDGRALLGYDAKPLMPRMHDMITRFTDGDPIFLALKPNPGEFSAFLRNMNVGYLVAYNWQNIVARDIVGKTDFLSAIRLPSPMPYVYTQNRVLPLADAEQARMLYSGDLRQGVCVEPGVSAQAPGRVEAGGGPPPEGYAAAFARLQGLNEIRWMDRDRSNRKSLEVDVTVPAMLVIAECYHPGWTATVDGKPVPVWQVNYLQQGLWLTPGRHTVELRFFPRSVARGLAAAACSMAILAAVGVLAWLRRRADGAVPGDAGVSGSRPTTNSSGRSSGGN